MALDSQQRVLEMMCLQLYHTADDSRDTVYIDIKGCIIAYLRSVASNERGCLPFRATYVWQE